MRSSLSVWGLQYNLILLCLRLLPDMRSSLSVWCLAGYLCLLYQPEGTEQPGPGWILYIRIEPSSPLVRFSASAVQN